MQRVPQANTTNHARALRQPLLYIEEVANQSLTAEPESKPGEQHSIIEQHKYDEAPCPCAPKPAIAAFQNR
ncbi:hypothetical protein ACIP86_29880 [Pseudomonas neuropathica]|jgi:hypothetical protein|uniref:hypothetical protein n=1 Tax=Pseudomonas TaxID=286 RepID=UPI000AAD608B|nr:hypothetical protein [Pseudomonas sp. 29]